MSVFNEYAEYYDLLYQEKDYVREADYVARRIREQLPDARLVLDIGCGTGAHAFELVRLGFDVTGIDLSPEMIQRASSQASEGRGQRPGAPRFAVGDLRHYRHPEPVDVVVSLFHVVSYQTSNQDLLDAFTCVAGNLRSGGMLLFDCWHGPGVLRDPPQTRVRRLQGEGFRVTRIAEPVMRPGENRVDVNYEILVERAQRISRFAECHAMRYLFTPELDFMLKAAGLTLIAATRWMDDQPPGDSDWNACYVAIK